MQKNKLAIVILFLIFSCISLTNAQTHNIQVDFKKNGIPIQKTMYGIFFEDINYGADGGLYAELVKNRSFEFPEHLMGWNTFGKVEIKDNGPFNNNPHYVHLSYAGHDEKHTGLENEGFFGIGVKKDAEYRFSVWTKSSLPNGSLKIEIIDTQSNIIASQKLEVPSSEWKQYELILKSSKTEAKAKLRIFLTSKSDVDLEHISLFPVDTWKGRNNGLRKDLAQALYDLKPGVFRFPGGCIVEGTDLATRYQWKNTIVPVENRKLNENRWQYTFTNRFFPDYYQSYGLGFFEFFQLAEDIGAEPLPVLSCGLACQFQNKDIHAHVPVAELNPYVQDALDLIEFANGNVSTKYGKIRAEMGHPEPFNLKLIAIGNEQWGSLYPERLEPFINAIRAKYPEIKIIGSAGPSPDGNDFDYGWEQMKRLKADLVDEHYYRSPEWFLSNAARYDKYDRKGPKVFAGEYACHPKNRKNNFESALCEAAFMTGFERNADVVQMCTYAPLFSHVDGWQWKPDLIWFDNLRVVKSVNYYVQQLYGNNPGTNVLPTFENKTALTGQDGIYASSSYDKNKNEIILKIANTSDSERSVTYHLKGLKNSERKATKTVITSSDLDAENTLDNPENVVPTSVEINIAGNDFELKIEPKSFYLLNIKL
ncbi:Alpha-L-arabinofuranosidase domain protein [uncultured Paludibacter sp.]|uniref:non-reducing end alpha-L-arabinofuranosidase n=1 Tax=uncultured Paludibacter sp. TaxID=497635 RepID=A0A653AHD8_9BACT|nr:Alpha-L-arabinofuranosidase domain protein [uncultured Paludibacter sp.]